jgi:hypothetical protein
MNHVPSSDAAWVAVDTPLNVLQLEEFIGDLERLFRINSMLEIHRWNITDTNRIMFEASNLSNGKGVKSELLVEQIDNGLYVRYSNLLKTSTSIQVKPAAMRGSRLIITDDYSGTEEDARRQRLDEVDRSLTQWGQDLHNFLHSWHRWSWLPPWRWYMCRIWQPMKPSARRITLWILWLTLGEIALTMLLLTILVIEQ